MRTSFDEFDPETVDRGGLPAAGKCQLLVTDVDERDGYVSVTHQILAHEAEGQVGKTSYNNLSVAGKAAKRAFLFAYATGILTKEEVASAKAEGTDIDIPFESAVGTVYYATLEASVYNNKPKCRAEWDMKPLDDPKANEYPYDPEFTPDRVDEPAAPEPAPEPEKPAPPAKKEKPAIDAVALAKKRAAEVAARRAAATPPTDDIPF